MDKRLLPWYVLVFAFVSLLSTAFIGYEIFRHGVQNGLYVVLLVWSMYVLCVPAAHGRLVLGALMRWLTRKSWFLEPYVWGVAVAVNVVAMIFAPSLYRLTIPTFVFYRMITIPSAWLVFVVGAMGTWHRTFVGHTHYMARRTHYTLVRHLITAVGVALFLYVTHLDFVILLNTTATG